MFDILHSLKGTSWDMPEKDVLSLIRSVQELVFVVERKIVLFQQIELMTYDHENRHLPFQGGTLRHPRSWVTKTYRRWYNQQRKRYSDFHGCLSRQLGIEQTAALHATRLKKDLSALAKALDKEVDVTAIQSVVNTLESVLRRQVKIVEEIQEEFVRFVGSPPRWESDYQDNEWVMKEKEKHLAQWKRVLAHARSLKEMFRNELRILTNQLFNSEDVASWNAQFKSHADELLQFLGPIQRFTKKLRELGDDDDFVVYHAHLRSRPVLFPLSENRFPNGLFVCVDNLNYALTIKSRQLMDNQPLAVTAIVMKTKIFSELFTEDPHYGVYGHEASEEAYEHAYVLPVSKFPDFNRFASWNLIHAVQKQSRQ